MKMLVEQKDVEGLDLLLGEVITVFCALYFYTGKLVGVYDKLFNGLNPPRSWASREDSQSIGKGVR